MRRGQGFFTTLLMIVPMTAVPVMAVFGIPQFVPAARPITPDAVTARRAPFIESRIGHSDAHPGRDIVLVTETSLSLFDPPSESAQSPTAPAPPVWAGSSVDSPSAVTADPRPNTVPAARAGIVPADAILTGYHTAQIAPSLDNESVLIGLDEFTSTAATERYQRRTPGTASPVTQSQQPLRPTWREAVDRLNELGIRTFRLTPGMQPGTFQFSCQVSSVDDPRLSRWFDDEATEPLDAVARVLRKVEDWNRLQ